MDWAQRLWDRVSRRSRTGTTSDDERVKLALERYHAQRRVAETMNRQIQRQIDNLKWGRHRARRRLKQRAARATRRKQRSRA